MSLRSVHEAPRLAASLALHTLLSIAPLLVIAVAIAGVGFGAEAARGQISQEVSAVVGPRAGEAIEGRVANAQAPEAAGSAADGRLTAKNAPIGGAGARSP